VLQPHVHALELAQQRRAVADVFMLQIGGVARGRIAFARQMPLQVPPDYKPRLSQDHAQG
jgi:hypothetical protein